MFYQSELVCKKWVLNRDRKY